MSVKVERFDLDQGQGYECYGTLILVQDGDWIRASDYDAALAALALVLDSVDYTAGNCRVNEMVGAVLQQELLSMARDVLGRS
jgi:hypothetical protein